MNLYFKIKAVGEIIAIALLILVVVAMTLMGVFSYIREMKQKSRRNRNGKEQDRA